MQVEVNLDVISIIISLGLELGQSMEEVRRVIKTLFDEDFLKDWSPF